MESKLTPIQSNKMFHRWGEGLSHRQLAAVFGVSAGTIRNELLKREVMPGQAHYEGHPAAHHGDAGTVYAMGPEVLERMYELHIGPSQLAWDSGVDTYQIDQIVHFGELGKAWCVPPDDYRKLMTVLWPDDGRQDGQG